MQFLGFLVKCGDASFKNLNLDMVLRFYGAISGQMLPEKSAKNRQFLALVAFWRKTSQILNQHLYTKIFAPFRGMF